MADSDSLTPQERSQRLLQRLGKPPEPSFVFDADLIPDIEEPAYERTQADIEMDTVLSGIDIIDVYQRFCGKMTPRVGNKTESIMISCPKPDHPDKDPSAWISTRKQTWFCGGCQEGGDIYDIVAYHLNMSVPGYKTDGSFPVLREFIAEQYGYHVIKGMNGESYIVAPPEEDAPTGPPLALVPDIVALPTPPPVEEELDEDLLITEEERKDLYIDWENILPGGTFMDEWMKACVVDDLADEYYFWLGLQALGFAAQTDVLMADFLPVKANLNICLYGPTGGGKSRSTDPYTRLIKAAMPFTGEDHYDPPTGVHVLPVPGSAEALVDSLRWDIVDSSSGEITGQGSVNGLFKIEELASFMSKASRTGSSLKEIVIELYDILDDDIVISARTTGVVKAHNPYCQILTTTQPKAIHAFLRKTDAESGFLNRWIFAAGLPRTRPTSYGGIKIDIDRPSDILMGVRMWAGRGHTYTLEGRALQVWDDFFHSVIAPMKTGEVEMDSMMARVDLTLKKLMILFSTNLMVDNPTEETVEAAIKLYPYLKASYSMLGRDIGFNDTAECQDRIIEVIRIAEASGVRPSRREIVRRVGKKFDLDLIERAMKTLLALDIVSEEKTAGKGRPTTRYFIAG